MNKWIFVEFLTFSSFIAVAELLTAKMDLLEGQVIDGGNISLKCQSSLLGSSLLSMTWYVTTTDIGIKQIYLYDHFLGLGGLPEEEYVNRTEYLIEGQDRENITLVIMKAVFLNDDGSYYCVIDGTGGIGQATSNNVPTLVAVEAEYSAFSIKSDAVLELNCTAGPSRPPPDIQWTIDGNDISGDVEYTCTHSDYCITEGIINITVPLYQCGHQVMCIVTQDFPTMWSPNYTHLICQFAIVGQESRLDVEKGQDVTIQYNHTLDDIVSLWWEKNDTFFTEFSGVGGGCEPEVERVTCAQTETGHSLTIRSADLLDSDQYTCSAEIDMGITTSNPVQVDVSIIAAICVWGSWECPVLVTTNLLVVAIGVAAVYMLKLYCQKKDAWDWWIYLLINIAFPIIVFCLIGIPICTTQGCYTCLWIDLGFLAGVGIGIAVVMYLLHRGLCTK